MCLFCKFYACTCIDFFFNMFIKDVSVLSSNKMHS